jgi:branched-chain amino acid transport system permease protein
MMSSSNKNYGLFAVLAIAVVLFGAGFSSWQFLLTLALAKGLVVLGLLLLLRTGLVSFGQALFYCLGAYTAGVLSEFLGVDDVLLQIILGIAVAVAVAAVLGLLMARYRNIFFAMLSLAFSMVLYGGLVKTTTLGSTDGVNVKPAALFGHPLADSHGQLGLLILVCVLAFLAVCGMYRYFHTPLGRLSTAIRDNEIRVEYMGADVYWSVYVKYLIAAALAGAGGAIAAVVVGHVDPEMSYWATSGEFLFVAILAGTGSVIAPFLGAILFEAVRSLATQYTPEIWQLMLGAVMLAIIVFLPGGLWSLFQHRQAKALK